MYPDKLSAEDAKHPKDAERVEGSRDLRPSQAAAMESVSHLLTAINRAILIVSCLRPISKNSEPEIRTLLAELSDELADARMQLAMLKARLAELEEGIGH